MNRISDALNAYAAFAKPLANGMEARDAPAPVPGSDFAAVLKDAAKVAIGTVKEAEAQSAAAIAGKADIREVVAAVTNAEMTLETVVTVRDKVINAYNEIMRMPI
ncbi:Flagellar hook-basal body complex protein FliE 1 [Magnetospirillum sp. UT-4]|nr:flagellar hook-basal body complex protein FliE [Magnetospirillum sp. UT-4]CAA7612791.1 Flagellar hook-basal body complex protein FliE 1 [Magnetospirillum sp. UT-4]